MQPLFPKTRPHCLYYDIARNQESFGVTYLLYLENK